MQCMYQECKDEVEQHEGSGRKRRYCSESCKQKAKRARANLQRATEATRNTQEATRNGTVSRLMVVPCTIDQANAYVAQMHRHHGPVLAARLTLAVADEAGLIRGVAIVARPVARLLDDGWSLEVRRLATDGCPNACSALYGAAWRAARAIGYKRLVTYTMPSEGESGASLRAVGWRAVEGCGGGSWNRKQRKRADTPFLVKKTRWEVTTSDYASCAPVVFPFSAAAGEAAQDALF